LIYGVVDDFTDSLANVEKVLIWKQLFIKIEAWCSLVQGEMINCAIWPGLFVISENILASNKSDGAKFNLFQKRPNDAISSLLI